MSLSLNPQILRTTKFVWYYEERGGLNIIHQIMHNGIYLRTDNFTIPWSMIKKSLGRKEEKHV